MGQPVVVLGDTFAGTIIAPDPATKGNPPKVFSISGVYDTPGQGSTKVNSKLVVVKGGKGTYLCPACGAPHTVTANAGSGTTTSEGKPEHCLGDAVVSDAHTTVAISATSGQGNVTDV